MGEQMEKKKLVFNYEKGLHARIAAMIVQKADKLQKKYNVVFKVRKGKYTEVPLNSILLLIALKIKAKDEIHIITIGDQCSIAGELMRTYLQSNFDLKDQEAINSVDNILQDNIMTAENIFKNMANGLLVINEKDVITLFNPEAERIFGISADDVIGQNINEVFPDSKLPQVSSSLKPEIAYTQNIGNYTVIANSTPIIIDNAAKGAVTTFEDISKMVHITWQLKEIKELKEKYQLILETVQDGICVINQDGFITYTNGAYHRICGQTFEQLNIKDISPNGIRMQVLKTGKKIVGGISKKRNGITIVANVNPIFVDGKLLGALSVVKDITEVQELMEKLNRVSAKAEYLQEELIRTKKLGPAFNRIIGNSGKIMDSMAIAAKAAQGVYTVLIRGESGTGKELIAEAIHYSSSRAKEPYIRVNCGAIPANLLESELFGHEKGAFTGAFKTKFGRFELANHGTIFLDEIAEMGKNMQVKLLRVVQNKEFQRLGGEKTIKLDVRIITATNQKLETLVEKGDFREDLYYRLNVIPILLPPLRDRKEDIPALVEFFVKKICDELGKELVVITKNIMDVFTHYSWPGNVRELENLMARLIILLDEQVIQMNDLPQYILENSNAAIMLRENRLDLNEEEVLSWEEYEKIIIKKALKKYGSFNSAGKALGLTHKTVAAKAKKYNIEKG